MSDHKGYFEMFNQLNTIQDIEKSFAMNILDFKY